MDRIKVLQVNKLYYPAIGGIEKVVQQLSEGLNKSTDLKVLVCQKKGKGGVEFIKGVEVHRSRSLGVIASVPISVSFIWKFRSMAKGMDIVHLHMPFPLGDLAYLLSGYHGKIIVSWHSDVVKQKHWMVLYRPLMECFLKRVDLILVSAAGIAKGSRYLSRHLEKCRVVPFAVENWILEAGREYLLKNGYERKNDMLHFLFIGRLVYYKGCSVLLEAFAQIKERVHLTIIGSGELGSQLKQQSEDLNISDRITFEGKVPEEDIRRCFEKADVFILPSIERSEAFGLVQMEAMAYGLPVINTNLPSGVPEVSLHMQTGLTVEPGNVEQLKRAMEWMIFNPEKRVAMGVTARDRVEKVYTENSMIANVNEIYNELLSES